jgi:hypothetical protein
VSECRPTAPLLPLRPGGFGNPFWQLASQDIPAPVRAEGENFRIWPDAAVTSIRPARKLSGDKLAVSILTRNSRSFRLRQKNFAKT